MTEHNHAHTAGDVNDPRHSRRLIATLGLTGTVFVAEVIGAVLTGSLALLVDAGHMLTDISVLTASTVTAILIRRKPNAERTWGWARLEVITAAGGAIALLFVGLYALVEAISRLFNGGEEVQDPALLLFFGILGLAANLGSLAILMTDRAANLNMKAAFLEVANDALGSVAVVISAVLVMTTGWNNFDSVAGLVIAVLMIPRAGKLLHSSMRVLLEETPEGLDLTEVREHLENVSHVVEVHDLHANTVATGMPTLSAHVVVDADTIRDYEGILTALQTCVRDHFPVSVEHSTFQIEPEGYKNIRDGVFHK
ncbi:cation diffusion facilitator family transporter [Bifidobacterium sp. SMB2]|uniref:Cation diffusion facilitator family transporter n=1 Tax=Bifidobacterium saimiriisciurei TaxID=2661627 RepID=A0ABX0CC62_9BIFI|nr:MULTISPECIES: cation diffusion facilitator family transporter [Bifidobacterium]NEG95391.1 cation diffusion facilitator family transporter [Bifidobacterium sp. SMB2]NEH11425.1 cation diffusion facilitator family transporter [Bifidobacterium saimiriisciurei]